jgi:hypothetical protein
MDALRPVFSSVELNSWSSASPAACSTPGPDLPGPDLPAEIDRRVSAVWNPREERERRCLSPSAPVPTASLSALLFTASGAGELGPGESSWSDMADSERLVRPVLVRNSRRAIPTARRPARVLLPAFAPRRATLGSTGEPGSERCLRRPTCTKAVRGRDLWDLHEFQQIF